MTTDTFLTQMDTFFEDFRKLEASFWSGKVSEDITLLERTKHKWYAFQQELEDLQKHKAPQFNIFNVLKIQHRETKVHTPMLCHLLDPEASHGQGSLFWDSFVTQVLGLDFTFNKISHLTVFEEYSSEKLGRIDIYLSFVHQGDWKGIIIENKIYAGDQHEQMHRYHRFALEEEGLEEADIWLVYLKPHKAFPTPKSIDTAKAEEIHQKGRLLLIDYHRDIQTWLTNAVSQVATANVQLILNQYLQVLQSL